MSLSTVINTRSPGHRDLIAACPDDRILAESDYNNLSSLAGQTWDMIMRVALVKGWTIESEWAEDVPIEQWGVVRKLEQNWASFRAGSHRKRKNSTQEY